MFRAPALPGPDPGYYLRQAEEKSALLHKLLPLIFTQNKYLEQLYKTCDGLLGLQRRTEAELFDKACQMAIDHHNYTNTFMKNILTNNMTDTA